jgi:serine/threonine protein kinase/WD40 repeat protein
VTAGRYRIILLFFRTNQTPNPHYLLVTNLEGRIAMPADLQKARELFLHAVGKLPPEQWDGHVAEACGGDAELAKQVGRLLKVHREAGSFLDRPAPGAEATAVPFQETAGTVIGPYKLLQQIGEGGMGTVFMAEQTQPVQRKVALKVIKAGMDSRQVIARFAAERQALAMMDHVNIARVFDAGATESGRPYFVMELVHGVPITKYCDDNQLTPRERLELFVPVCQAIQHAHQKGIIHRDIKPSNVMITLYDGKPVPKVIDFGVAKATEQKLTERSLFTQYGTMVGTLEYMSPEQAEMSALGADTRSDIYSLGVLLYELLTGSTPLSHKRVKEAAYAEVLRMIKEEEPPKPSTRLSDSGAALVSISAQRHMEPAKLAKLVRGELDWIVMKTLEKDRNRRYETAKDFAADVQRYLHDEPVQACPPSALYRFRKFARRNKGPVLAASLLLLALFGGIIGTTLGMVRATVAEGEAVKEAEQKEHALTEKETALRAARQSERDGKDQLFLALLNQARAKRVSGRPGQRFEALKAIRQAAQIRVTPELRTEAIAALVVPDVEIAQEWDGFPDGTLSLAFDANFERFARLHRSGSVTVGRLSDNREEVIAHLPSHGKPPFWGLWLSPDCRFVAYGHSRVGDMEARGVCVWKLDGPEPALLLDLKHGVGGNALAFRPNGRQLAIGHVDKSVSVYDLATGDCVQRLANTVTALHLAFHPRESRLAVACRSAGVLLFDVDTGAELPALRHPPGISCTYSVAWHPDGRRLAAGCNDRKIHLWDTETGTEVMPPWVGTGVDGSVVAFNHAGDRLLSRDWSGLAHVWDTATGRLLLTAPAFYWQASPTDRLHGYDFEGAKVRLWRLAAGRELRVLRRRNADSLEVICSPVVHADGRILATQSGRENYPDLSWLCFFDLSTGEELASVKLAEDRPFCFHESIGWMTSGPSGLLQWPARSDAARPDVLRVGPPKTLSSGLGARLAVGAGASADGGVLAVPDGSFTTLIHRERPEQQLKLGPQHDVRFAAVSPTGRWVATCGHQTDGRSKSTRIWDADTGQLVHELPMVGATTARFSPDGRWLATTHAGTQLWEVGTWQPGRRFEGRSPLFSPDSRLIALSAALGTVRLVETDTGREVARLTGPEATWYSPVCFTPDGTRLIATGADNKTIHIWDLRAIRQPLKAMELDWDWPEFGPADPTAPAAKLVKVEVLPGDLHLTREQKARQAMEHYRLAIKANPNDAKACNELAWVYLTAPEALRDVKAGLLLAEKAVHLDSANADYRNTLGVAYYRAGKYHEAVKVLRTNLDKQADKALAFDLYFLAMSHHRLGDTARARDYYDWAVRWQQTQPGLLAGHLEELAVFQAEAEELLKQDSGAKSEK